MKRHPHDVSQSPEPGTLVGIVLGEPPAIVTSVIGFNKAYDAWIVKADWKGRPFQLPIFYRDQFCGWAERLLLTA